jgi:hypothetical protein
MNITELQTQRNIFTSDYSPLLEAEITRVSTEVKATFEYLSLKGRIMQGFRG